ncbi:MAG: ROK family protein [Candidatus Obscuribacter phosphatis]|uniref:ROK family protein n=1 Tax=Candidatus Obscuribacter phosphatis TaxID=1906157 RepID=A0A8J7PKS4_9BACT|nr:ROK family protein [Candidatus Obscuribacter phosphatis]
MLNSTSIDSLLKNNLPALGIDLGGTKIRAALVKDGRVVSQPRQIATPNGADNIIKGIVDLVQAFQHDGNEAQFGIAGVGIATAGIVDCNTGEILGSTGNLPGWSGTSLKKVIESQILLPVHVDNDANAAAYGEASARGLMHSNCVVAVTLGTGIGGGLVINGKMFRGAHWAGGEIGHLRLNLGNKRLCTCGLFDCWEAYGSGRGLAATGRDILSGLSAEQTPLAKDIEGLTTHAIVEAARNGDIVGKRILHMWHEHVAAGIASLAHILDPDLFVVTGGLADCVDFALLQEMVVDRVLPRIGEKMTIHKSELEGLAGIIGAAQLVLDNLLDRIAV